MYALDDTIAAIATPVGAGGIGIVRLSGPEALPILIAQRLAPSTLWIVIPLAAAVYAFGAYRLARVGGVQGEPDLRRLQVPAADAYTTGR